MGEKATFSGYLIEFDRLKKCTYCVDELESLKRTHEADVEYYDKKIDLIMQQNKLEVDKMTKERDFVEKGLKDELAKKSVWYRQPVFVAIGTVILIGIVGYASSGVRN